MWHSREVPDLARDGNRECELKKSVFPMSVTLCWSESECAWECVFVRVRECRTFPHRLLHPWPLLLSWGCLAWRSRWFWVKKEQLDELSTQTHSDSKWGPPSPSAPLLLRPVLKPPSSARLWRRHLRERKRDYVEESKMKGYGEKKNDMPLPVLVLIGRPEKKLTHGGTRRELTNILWR